MVEENNTAQLQPSLATYAKELQLFLESRSVPFGSASALPLFLERLRADPSLAEETGSLLRAFSYTEDQQLGRTAMLRFLSLAVGGAEPELLQANAPGSLRPLFDFVGAALRPPSFGAAPFEDEDSPVVSSLPESAPAAPPSYRSSAPPAATPQHRADVFLRAQEMAESAAAALADSREPVDHGFQPLTPAAEPAWTDPAPLPASTAPSAVPQPRRRPRRRQPSPESLGQRWILPVVAGGLAVLGVGAFFARPAAVPLAPQRLAGSAGAPAEAPGANSCIAAPRSGVSRAALDERGRWAQRLLDGKLYEAALPELQDIAHMDPGFPGVDLNESDALLHLGRLDEARASVDQQLGLVDCLARLPSTALESYCQVQYSGLGVAGCRPQLAQLRQAAQLQSALVQLSIDHWGETVPDRPRPIHTTRASAGKRAVRRAHPLPPANDEDQDVPIRHRKRSTP